MPNGEIPEPPDFRAIGRATAEGQVDSSWFEKFAAAIRHALEKVLEVSLTILLTAANSAIQVFFKALAEVREKQGDQIAQIAGTVLDEMFESNRPSEVLRNSVQGRSAPDLNRALGLAVRDTIIGPLDGRGRLTGDLAQEISEKMLGVGLGGTISAWMMGAATEMVSLGTIEQFAELPNALGTAADFGIFARTGLTPVVNTVVRDPFQEKLNATFRPRGMSVTEAIRSFLRGRISRDELEERLAATGVPPQDFELLINLTRRFLSDADVFLLVQTGAWTQEEAIQYLTDSGFDRSTATSALAVEALRRIRAKTDELLNTLEASAVEEFISIEQFSQIISSLPLTEEERRWEREIVRARRDLRIEKEQKEARDRERFAASGYEVPIKFLTLAQMRTAFIDGIVNLVEWDRFLNAEGYGPADKTVLTLQLLLDAKEEAERRERRKEAERKLAAAKTAETTPPPS